MVIVRTAPVHSKYGFLCLDRLEPHHYTTMRRSEATYIRLPVTTNGISPESQKNYGSFCENARVKQARRALSFTVIGTFIAVFLVLSLGSLPSRLLFQPTTDVVDAHGKGECG